MMFSSSSVISRSVALLVLHPGSLEANDVDFYVAGGKENDVMLHLESIGFIQVREQTVYVSPSILSVVTLKRHASLNVTANIVI